MLAHKTLDVRPETWRRLRINAELSGVTLRDFVTYLIETSAPVNEGDPQYDQLLQVVEKNRAARAV